MDKKKLNIFLPLLFALVLALGMQLGIKYTEINGVKKPVTVKLNYQSKLDDIINFIDVRYYDTINKHNLYETAISSIFESLDPFSTYIPPIELAHVNESLEGNFDGIGIEFYILEDTIMVVSPISGGPSEALGIRSGDKIVLIDSQNVAGIGITNEDVIGKLRGKKNTKVSVGILRAGHSGLLTFNITRDEIPIFSVDVAYMVTSDIGYIKINRFSAKTHEEFRRELEILKGKGMSGLILDLRQNPGGFLNAATAIADEFLPNKKLIVYTEGKASSRNDFYATTQGLFEEGSVLVLIDEGSASASEIVSGAIQDWDRGLIIGRKSFGKGLVQEQYPLNDGSALRLTVARYYTPSGRCIQKPLTNFQSASNSTNEKENLDTTAFQSSLGKKLYGGGGITPDIEVPVDTNWQSPYLLQILINGIIPQFVYQHYAANQTYYLKTYLSLEKFRNEFFINDKLLEAFTTFAAEKGIKKNSKDFVKSKKYLQTRLKAYIARQAWKEEGYYSIINEIDNVFEAAMDSLKKKSK